MIAFILKSSVCLGVFIAFYYLVLEREKMHQFNRFYLLITILFSFIIPFYTYEIIEIVPVVQHFEPISNDPISKSTENFVVDSVQNEIQVEEKTDYIPYVILSFYILTTLILSVRFGKNYFKLVSKINSNPTLKYKNANLVLMEEKILPHSFLNSIFVNSEDYNNRNIEDELFTHELVHVTQKHTLDILFIEFLKVVFWFNPLLYIYKKAIQLNHEFLADEEIVKKFNNVPFYQNLLLQKSNGLQTVSLASNLNYLVTKKRLIMMTKNTSKKIAILKKIAVFPILATLIYFFCVEIVAQEKIVNINSNVKNKEAKEVEFVDYKTSDEEYFKGVRFLLYENAKYKNTKIVSGKLLIDKFYEDLTEQEIEKFKYIKQLRQTPLKRISPTNNELESFKNSKKYAIWIDGKNVLNNKLNEYKPSDFAYFGGSVILKNARTIKHPQPFQYWLYTDKYYTDNNMGKYLKHYPNDTICVSVTNNKNVIASNVKGKKQLL